jgi:uncharacterized membrane protein
MTKTTNRIILLLILVGLIVSGYLAYAKFSGIPVNCSILSGCQTVEQSKYSVMFGVPVAVYGVLFYLGLIFATFIRINQKYKNLVTKLILLATTFGFLFSVYLTYLELYVIFAICVYCVVSAIISTALFFLSLYENIVVSSFLRFKKEEYE